MSLLKSDVRDRLAVKAKARRLKVKSGVSVMG
jgi:hypothetical protein